MTEELDHEKFMQFALKEAKRAYELDEVPIGCVIVKGEEVIARGYNTRNTFKNVLCHAEILAIDKASQIIGDWRLEECTMYVTIEPCPMCSGAIVQARMRRLVFGAKNPKAGCCGSILNILNEPRFNHQVEIMSGVLEDECSILMKDFFREFRKK